MARAMSDRFRASSKCDMEMAHGPLCFSLARQGKAGMEREGRAIGRGKGCG